jgi:polyphenol oxidase
MRSTDRRQFLLKGSLALGGLALVGGTPSPAQAPHAGGPAGNRPDPLEDCVPWPPPPINPISFYPDMKLPVRTRKSAFELTPDEVTRLRKAYRLLRELTVKSPDDPRGWLRQANVHCWYCGGEGGDGINATVEIHGSWRFLPWHRMYLYFHERILAALLGDNTFALPYWDWDAPDRNRLPPAYAEEMVNGEPNPLFDPNRGAKTGDVIPDSIVGPAVMAGVLRPLTFDTPGGFGGTPDGGDVNTPQNPTASMGTLEAGPHGGVHIWTGDPTLQSAKADMGILATAARDPVFFAHHGNVDRLWDVWLNQPPKPGEPKRTDPQDPNWYIQRFTFYDQNDKPNFVAMSIADTISSVTSMRYRYPSVTLLEAARAPRTFILAAPAQPVPLAAGPTKAVPVPPEVKAAMARPPQPIPRPPAVVVLHIDGLDVPPDQQARIRVFLDKPDADDKTPITIPNFVGTITVLAKHLPGKKGSMMHPAKHPPQNAAFELSGELAKLLTENAEVSVKLVPLPGTSEKLTYRKAYLSVRE